MTPKEKASQIFTLMLKHQHKTADSLIRLRARTCALEAVYFIVTELQSYRDLDTLIFIDDKPTNPVERITFYRKVQKELMKPEMINELWK